MNLRPQLARQSNAGGLFLGDLLRSRATPGSVERAFARPEPRNPDPLSANRGFCHQRQPLASARSLLHVVL